MGWDGMGWDGMGWMGWMDKVGWMDGIGWGGLDGKAMVRAIEQGM